MNKKEKLNKLLGIVKDFYVKNNLDVDDLMFFYTCGISGIIAQEKEKFDYENLVTQIKKMILYIKKK